MAYTARTDHNKVVLTLHKAIFNRIAFLEENAANADIISNYIVEVANAIEGCLGVSKKDLKGVLLATADPARVGNEVHYTTLQKSLIADIVAVHILRRVAAQNAGSKNSADKGQTYLSGAKAGSVEVSYDAFDAGTTAGLQLKANELISQYEKSAFKTGLQMGCILDICASCAEKFLAKNVIPTEFINIQT